MWIWKLLALKSRFRSHSVNPVGRIMSPNHKILGKLFLNLSKPSCLSFIGDRGGGRNERIKSTETSLRYHFWIPTSITVAISSNIARDRCREEFNYHISSTYGLVERVQEVNWIFAIYCIRGRTCILRKWLNFHWFWEYSNYNLALKVWLSFMARDK